MHFLSASPRLGGGGGGHQAIGVRIGDVLQTLQQIQAFEAEEMWGLDLWQTNSAKL